MKLLQPYHGNYANAKSASTKFDIESIIRGCQNLETESSYLDQYSGMIRDSGSSLSANNFCVNGNTFLGSIDDCCSNIQSVRQQISDTISQILAHAESVYNQIQEQLNYEAQVKEQNEYNRRKGK